MSNTVKVYWTPCYNKSAEDNKTPKWANILWLEPELALTRLVRQREKTTNFFGCPSFVDFYKNTYAVKSPLDLNISVGYTESGQAYINTDRYDQEFFNKFIFNRNEGHTTFNTFSVAFGYLFYSEESVIIEQIPANMDSDFRLTNGRLISGRFNIGKWWRPVEYACEVIDDTKPLEFVRGTPMFYVRFITENNKKVELIRTDFSNEVRESVDSCTSVKKVLPRNSLEENYQAAESYLNAMKDKLFPKKKCPFSKLWKK